MYRCYLVRHIATLPSGATYRDSRSAYGISAEDAARVAHAAAVQGDVPGGMLFTLESVVPSLPAHGRTPLPAAGTIREYP